ncbi:MAG: hypothetical protein IJ571_09250 [Ruminococcus sp.]|nr:hypothetical protein [Ruminococcus sp.]
MSIVKIIELVKNVTGLELGDIFGNTVISDSDTESQPQTALSNDLA